jgi:hypothetical protein
MHDLDRVAKAMVRAAKARATKSGVPFNLTPEDIVIPPNCPILGIPIIVGQKQANDNSPSLDRIMPLMGYVRGNIVVISNRANRIKNNALPWELQAVANWLHQHISKDWMNL